MGIDASCGHAEVVRALTDQRTLSGKGSAGNELIINLNTAVFLSLYRCTNQNEFPSEIHFPHITPQPRRSRRDNSWQKIDKVNLYE